jgi:hypothetical protein
MLAAGQFRGCKDSVNNFFAHPWGEFFPGKASGLRWEARVIGWYLSYMLRRNVAEYISACAMMPDATQVSIAQHVIDKIEPTESLPSKEALIDVLKVLARDAMADRHRAVALGAQSVNDPEWNAAAIVETWGCARLSYLTGRISHRAFDKVDALVFRFVTSKLGSARLIDRWKDS